MIAAALSLFILAFHHQVLPAYPDIFPSQLFGHGGQHLVLPPVPHLGHLRPAAQALAEEQRIPLRLQNMSEYFGHCEKNPMTCSTYMMSCHPLGKSQ